MEQLEEIRKTYKEREQEREDRINKMEKQLARIYEKLLSIDIEVRETTRRSRLKEIEKEIKKLNDEKKYLEGSSDRRYDKIQDEMNWFVKE